MLKLRKTKKKCTICGKQSIPGLKPGHGKCQFHWDEGVWGTVWAKHVKKEREG